MKFSDVKDELINLRRQGYGCKVIARELGVSVSNVKRWLNKVDIPVQTYTEHPAVIITCKTCGVEVSTRRTNTLYCSDACRQRLKKININGRKKCKRCNRDIAGLQNVSFCSDICRLYYSNGKRTLRVIKLNCAHCGRDYLSRRANRFCSDACRKAKRNEVARARMPLFGHKCTECGSHFSSRASKRKYCSSICSKRFNRRVGEVKRRNVMRANGRVDYDISIGRLTHRDGRTCYICDEQMNYKADSNDDFYPSIEHIKPIAKGGTHTWDNVKLAHRKCNYEKSDAWNQ